MKIIVSHPTANANVRAAVSGLADRGLLRTFYTTVALFPDSVFYRLGSRGPLAGFKRRAFEQKLKQFTRRSPWFELGRLLAIKTGMHSLFEPEQALFSIDTVYQRLDKDTSLEVKKTGIPGTDAVYGYEDGALQSFQEAKNRDMRCFYDLPIGHWRFVQRLFSEESRLRPEWTPTLTGVLDSAAKLSRKDQELSLADHIFVASSFTRKTLEEFPANLAPVSIIPYGFPPVSAPKTYKAVQGRKLRLLFVGSLSQRKGIANLFEAIEDLEDEIELTLIGNKPVHNCLVLNNAVKKHRWIPGLPHDQVLAVMREHDVFVLPSLFEGFGLVITEAMSQGTPVITTERTCGPDIISHGENGWLVRAGSSEDLREQIRTILSDPSVVESVGKNARQTASERPWSCYGQQLAGAITNIIQEPA
jgi:glycosyltransferase involved in cell wall biosynthesis